MDAKEAHAMMFIVNSHRDGSLKHHKYHYQNSGKIENIKCTQGDRAIQLTSIAGGNAKY